MKSNGFGKNLEEIREMVSSHNSNSQRWGVCLQKYTVSDGYKKYDRWCRDLQEIESL